MHTKSCKFKRFRYEQWTKTYRNTQRIVYKWRCFCHLKPFKTNISNEQREWRVLAHFCSLFTVHKCTSHCTFSISPFHFWTKKRNIFASRTFEHDYCSFHFLFLFFISKYYLPFEIISHFITKSDFVALLCLSLSLFFALSSHFGQWISNSLWKCSTLKRAFALTMNMKTNSVMFYNEYALFDWEQNLLAVSFFVCILHATCCV